MTKYLYIFIALLFLFIPQDVGATAYYVDFSTTNGTFNGLATTTAFSSLDAFTEVARSAGDIAFVRRGVASTTNVTDLNFTSSGTIANPIKISADYDNLWNDFATSSQTYSVAVATSTFYASASITGIAAGDWIYVAGDCFEKYNSTSLNQCEFAYEVATVSGTALSLYLPYKGNQSGSALDLRVMPDNPQWNVASGDFQWNFDTDNYWLVKGMDIRTTDINGVEIDSSIGHFFMDDIFTGNGASDRGIVQTDDGAVFSIYKSRFFNQVEAIDHNASDVWWEVIIKNSFFNGNNVAASFAFDLSFQTSGRDNMKIYDTVFINYASYSIGQVSNDGVRLRNVKSYPTLFQSNSSNFTGEAFIEDFDQRIGENRYSVIGAGTNINTSLLLSTTSATFLRSGGGPSSTQVIPTTNTTSIWDFNKIKLFEYPIYTNTTSKQYDVYFMSTSTAAWTADPLATELWIECEYWAHDTNATSTRKIKKSTGVVDFNGSTAWQALSVTCVPTQTGILYLRGFYAKTLESGVMNEFFVDGTPVIQ